MEIFAAAISAGCEMTGGGRGGRELLEGEASPLPLQLQGRVVDEEQRQSSGAGDWSWQRLLRCCADQPVATRHVSAWVEGVR